MPSTTPFPGYNANQKARAATDAEQARLQSSTTQIAPSVTVRHPQAELGCVPIRQRIQLRMSDNPESAALVSCSMTLLVCS
jgi:hypothetical protein